AGEPVAAGGGAFGHAAQLLALTGLFAGLVSLGDAVEGAPDRTGTTRRFAVPPGAPTEPLPQRRRVDATPNGGAAGGGSVAGPTISARGPGAAQEDPDTPTRRIAFTKPKSEAPPRSEASPEGGGPAGGDGTGKGGPV
ncbi:hypothetical protein, partial [Streptomyces scabiei]